MFELPLIVGEQTTDGSSPRVSIWLDGVQIAKPFKSHAYGKANRSQIVVEQDDRLLPSEVRITWLCHHE